MFRAAGKRLLWAGKIRRRSFFSERELFLFRDQTFFLEIVLTRNWEKLSVLQWAPAPWGKYKGLNLKNSTIRVCCAWLVNTRQWKMSFSMPNCLKRLEWKMDEKPPLLLPLGEMRKWDVFSSEEEWKIIATHWNSWSKIYPKLTDFTINFYLIRESKGYVLRENFFSSECYITKN